MDPTRYGLTINEQVQIDGIVNYNNNSSSSVRLQDVEQFLRSSYCDEISAEFAYIESEHEREWLAQNYEQTLANRSSLSSAAQREIAELLIKSQTWDTFLATKFPSVKRYGAEGAESMMAFFRQIFVSAADEGVQHIVLGMPHRGKLNLLTTMLKMPPAKLFNKFKGRPEFPKDAKAMCDIASHFRKFSAFLIFFG